MNLKENLKLALEIFENSKQITITTHVNPDADALGSALSLYIYAKLLNKSVKVINYSETPSNLKFLPLCNEVIVFNEDEIDFILNSDAIFIVDLNDSSRTKSMEQYIFQSKAKKVMIDHHINPKEFCDVYCIDTDASSTGELIWRFFQNADNFYINQEIAENLYAAIMTDTGSFRFQRTTPEVHKIIAELIDAGANPTYIYEKIYNSNSLNATKLLGRALSSMNVFFDGKVCIMKIPREFLIETSSKDEDVDNFVEKTLSIEGVKMGILMAEITDRDEVRMSFRTKDNFSARDLALRYGGGGHFYASGARLYNVGIEDAYNLILNDLNEYMKNYQS